MKPCGQLRLQRLQITMHDAPTMDEGETSASKMLVRGSQKSNPQVQVQAEWKSMSQDNMLKTYGMSIFGVEAGRIPISASEAYVPQNNSLHDHVQPFQPLNDKEMNGTAQPPPPPQPASQPASHKLPLC